MYASEDLPHAQAQKLAARQEGTLLVFAQTSALAPFIYTIF